MCLRSRGPGANADGATPSELPEPEDLPTGENVILRRLSLPLRGAALGSPRIS